MDGILRVTPSLPFVRPGRMVERNLLVYRRTWMVIFSGFFEPLFYLMAMGYGLGSLVGAIALPDGRTVSYTDFVAPALLAASAMNGALYDSSHNFFFKLKYGKVYDVILATPMGVGDVAIGEVVWALIRGSLYAIGFLVVMTGLGLLESPFGLLAFPAAMLVGFAFAAVGMAFTTWVRKWQDFDLMQLAVVPMFLFSATFYPIDAYPGPLRLLVEATPLYRGVHLIRAITTGAVDPAVAVDIAYLAVMGLVGVFVVSRRMKRLLLT